MEEATQYFLGVLRSFHYGFGIDKGVAGFDALVDLPSFVWERKTRETVQMIFGPGPLGMIVDPRTNEVEELLPGGQAFRKGVGAGWVVENVVAPAIGGDSAPSNVCGRLAAIRESGEGAGITFQPPTHYSDLAVSQKWGVFSSKGYQPKLGMGKCTDPINFANCHGVMDAQLWMRNILASLHGCLPSELCWQPDGVSLKAVPLLTFR